MASLDGFDDFVRRSSAELLRYGRALTRDNDEAWDLVQEALTRIAERWNRQQIKDPTAYARATMVTLNIDRARRLRREANVLSRSGPRHEPPDQYDNGTSSDWLIGALRYLSPSQRTALALRYIDDLDVAAIAQRMGCRPGTARSHLSRGLDRLKAASVARDAVQLTEEK